MDTDTKPDQNNISIAKIIEQSHAMLTHAEAGEWEAVAEAEARHRQWLNEFFSNPSNITSELQIATILQELLQVNVKLEALSIAARDEAKSAFDSIRTGRTAVNAYTKNAI